MLDWSEIDAGAHAVAFERYRRLLGIRGRELQWRLPARAAGGELIGPAALVATWRLTDGTLLKLHANLASRPQPSAPLAGRLLAATQEPADGAGELPAWFVAWLLE